MRSLSAPRGLVIAAVLVLAPLGGCDRGAKEESPAAPAEKAASVVAPAKEPLEPLPASIATSQEKVLLGRRLFHDPILSGDGTLSCATCHSLDHGGAEPRPVSTGIRAQKGPINSPTVLNAHFQLAQFWDGRAPNLKEQARGPVANPIEMGADWREVEKKLAADEFYAAEFKKLYPDGIREDNVVDAIAEYEKSLITPAPFDDFLRGNKSAIGEKAQKGYALFKEVGCTSCHSGMLVGGSMYQKMGLVKDYFADRGTPTEADLGRFNHTKREEDKYFFKVPMLRNVELTWPYFHDGSRRDLGDAVRVMAEYQLGRKLDDGQVDAIVEFLKSLTGKLPEHARLPSEGLPERFAANPEGG